MLPLGLQILAATYVGVRLVDRRGARRKRSLCLKDRPLVRARPHRQPPSDQDSDASGEARSGGQLALSTAAVALTTAGAFYPPLVLVTLFLISLVTVPILKEVETSLLQEHRVKNDLLNSLASVGCLAMGHYLAASLLAWFYHLGTRLIAQIQGDAKRRLTQVFDLQEVRAYVLRDGTEVETPVDAIAVDDIVVVNTGETIPVDGVITAGSGAVDQHILTGESIPVEKEVGERVFASTLVVSGRLQVRTEKAGIETTVAKINAILANTADFKTSIQVKGEQWANGAAVPLLSLGLISLPALGFTRVMMLLYSSPSNNIRVLTSLQTLNYLALVSHGRVLVKDGRALESLKDVDTVLFDKTGTLTTDAPKVGEMIAIDGDAETLLFHAAAAEQRLQHPIAQAIVAKAKSLELPLPDIRDAHYKIGYGITVNIGEQLIQVGSARFMRTEGILIPAEIDDALDLAHRHGDTLVIVAVDRKVRGALEIKPQLRPELLDLVARLRARGVTHCAIVSGDHEGPTRELADQLGMDACYYDVLPKCKAEVVERLRRQGRKVCFIGDGINDAVAMKAADVSISLAGASSAATDLAQIIFLDGELAKLDALFDLSTELNGRLRQSVLICVAGSSVNLMAVYFLFLGVLPSLLWLSAVVPAVGVSHAMLPLLRMKGRPAKPAEKRPAMKGQPVQFEPALAPL